MKKIILLFVTLVNLISIANENFEVGYIGMVLYKEPYYFKTIVINSFPNSPGAVIPIGSEIIKIDNKKIYFLPLKEINDRLRGKIGTEVILTVKDAEGVVKEYTLTRVANSELSYDEKFDYYWGKIVPEKYLHTPNLDDLKAIKSKLCMFDNSISKDDFYWAGKKSKFMREYNYCMKLKSSEQKECLRYIVEQSNKGTTSEITSEIKQNANLTTNVEQQNTKSNAGWLAGLYIIQTASDTLKSINESQTQHINNYNNILNQNRIDRLNNTLNQQNIELQRINNTLKGTPNSIIRGNQRYY